ncbi:hypothetical protein RND71_005627 [Anisodus tanguticus]|uniref:HIT domain-containing protein n=1 Tax=Anisodus tanguticus TaxID=243964 RepID=A0AAE1VVM3_9SOLA|nr:hypothetical protein RND71_005627 [Anisodus tanguticus]
MGAATLDMRLHCAAALGREVQRFAELTADEISDCGLQHKKLASNLSHTTRHLLLHLRSKTTEPDMLKFSERYVNAEFDIYKDGPQAGQTVPHVHIHIIPRKSGDFEKKDEIYDALDVKEKEMKQSLDLDKERKDRSIEEMAEEAEEYRKLFL